MKFLHETAESISALEYITNINTNTYTKIKLSWKSFKQFSVTAVIVSVAWSNGRDSGGLNTLL